MEEHITCATALRLLANMLTVITGFGWLKFADARDGILSAPNLHHRIYLRALIGLSTAAFVTGLLSLAVASHGVARAAQRLASGPTPSQVLTLYREALSRGDLQ